MTTRDVPTSTTPANWAADLNTYAALWGVTLNDMAWSLTNVGGTADAVTADVDPELPGSGLAAGMKFTIKWGADNTGAATLNIGSVGAKAIVDADGSALAAGRIVSGRLSLIEYDGAEFRILTGDQVELLATPDITEYPTSISWTNDLPPNTPIMVECWGGGGGGGNSTGGNGGDYSFRVFIAGDLSSSVTLGIGAAGLADSGGSTTSFGSYMSAKGGSSGGAGNGTKRDFVGGSGGNTGGATDSGAASLYGGGGGASGGGSGVGGSSTFGGDGGDANSPGAEPGGGGGGGVAKKGGGKGMIRITVFR